MNTLTVFTDGGSRGNPGPSAIGVVIKNEKKENLKLLSRRIGENTNNVAEYTAVIDALEWIKENMQISKYANKQINHPIMKIDFFIDSKLVVNQLNGIFKMKEERLRILLFKIRQLEQEIKIPIYYRLIPREQNWEADRLVNQAMDQNYYVTKKDS